MSGTESVSTKRPTLKSQLFFKMPTIKLGGHMPLFIGLKKQTNKQHPWAAGCSGCTPSQQGFLAPSCQSSIDTVLCNRSMHASSRFSFSSFSRAAHLAIISATCKTTANPYTQRLHLEEPSGLFSGHSADMKTWSYCLYCLTQWQMSVCPTVLEVQVSQVSKQVASFFKISNCLFHL